MILKFQESEGIKVFCEHLPHLKTSTVGVFFLSGSVDEGESEKGITHLIEHMVFKGNNNIQGKELMRKIEFLGAHIDAFTSKEYTCFWIKVPGDRLKQSLSLFSQILSNPSMDSRELEKEKGVVIEEIGVSSSEPESKLIDFFYENFFSFPLGHPILGDVETIKSFTREDLLSFFKQHFHRKRTVISAVGDVDMDSLLEFSTENLSLEKNGKERTLEEKEGLSRVRFRYFPMEIDQVYGVVAFPGPSRRSNHRYTGAIVSTILGGGMSSRLFVKLREDQGLVYNIYSSMDTYINTGTFYIFFSTQFKNLRQVLLTIRDELRGFKKNLQQEEIDIAKNLTESRVLFSLESPYSRMSRIFGDFFTYGKVRQENEILDTIRKISLKDVEVFYNTYLTETPSLILLGREKYKKDAERIGEELFIPEV